MRRDREGDQSIKRKSKGAAKGVVERRCTLIRGKLRQDEISLKGKEDKKINKKIKKAPDG